MHVGNAQFFWKGIDPPFEPSGLINYPIGNGEYSKALDHNPLYSFKHSSLRGVDTII